MLAMLLFAVVATAETPTADDRSSRSPIDPAAFCANLKTAIAASAETPTPFASITGPKGDPKARWQPTKSFQLLGWCHIAHYSMVGTAPLGLRCTSHSWRPLAESRAETAQAVRQCTGVEPLPETGDRNRWPRETVFETPRWTIHVAEHGCDRCRGMPEILLWLEPRRGP